MGTESTTPSPPEEEPTQNYVRAGRPVSGDQLIGRPPPSPRPSWSAGQTSLPDQSPTASRAAPQLLDAHAALEGALDPWLPIPTASTPTIDISSRWGIPGTAVTHPPTGAMPPFAASPDLAAECASAARHMPSTSEDEHPATIIAPSPTAEPAPYVGTFGPFRDQLAGDHTPGIGSPVVNTMAEAVPANVCESSPPVTRPTSGGLAVSWIRAFTLLLKYSPALLALGGAIYFYQTMFGKMSVDELASQGLATPDAAERGGMSRADVMMHQTKTVAAAQARNVDFANQLAELGTDAIDPHVVVAEPMASSPVVVAPAPIPAPTPQAPIQVTVYAPSGSPRELLFTGPSPSPAFVRWARESRLSGVRASETSSRAMVDNVVYNVGDTVHRPLRIVLERVDAREKVVVFRDGSGSTVDRPY